MTLPVDLVDRPADSPGWQKAALAKSKIDAPVGTWDDYKHRPRDGIGMPDYAVSVPGEWKL